MGRDAIIAASLIGVMALLLMRKASAATAPSDIYDTRDAWASGDGTAPIDTAITDSFDARATNGGAPSYDASPPFLDLSDGTADTGFGVDATTINYDQLGNVISAGWSSNMSWNPTLAGQYATAIAQAERQYSLPANLLNRLAYQESHFRPDIINGTTRSSAGAIGMMQFMPERISGVPEAVALDPLQAIPTAAAKLAALYRKFGTWAHALAAYNWGEGNLSSWLKTGYGTKGQPMPAETQAYYSSVLADIGISTRMA